MTWNPLRKNILTTKPSPAFPVISREQEDELEKLFSKLQHIEGLARKLQKEMKKYLELLSQSAKLEQKVTGDLSGSQLCQQSAELRKIVEEYHSVTAKVAANNQDFSSACRQIFQDPLKKYVLLFSLVDAGFHQREQLLQDWRNNSSKVRKLESKERTGANVLKLERERQVSEMSAQQLVAYHASLVIELTQFMDKTLEFFNPTVQALVRTQLDYFGDLTRLFTILVSEPGEKTTPYNDFYTSQRIQYKLSQIKALSIIKK